MRPVLGGSFLATPGRDRLMTCENVRRKVVDTLSSWALVLGLILFVVLIVREALS
jgi:hypothetical protein